MLPLWLEITSLATLVTILAADLILAIRRPRVPSAKESALWIAFYIVLALAFAGMLEIVGGLQASVEFVAGWLTEYSLSVDNLFVFILIMGRFAVPRNLQQQVLMVGIIIALVLRGIFIIVGANLIANFTWVFYLFGVFLVYTAAKQAFGGDQEDGPSDNGLIRMLRKRISLSPDYDGSKIRTTIGGNKLFTPMLIVFIAIGSTDLLFALDSIPAIFGITQSPFIVFAANLFALMGLRQLYFLLGGLLDKLAYLKYGIALILAFIGVKLILQALHTNELPFVNGGRPLEMVPEASTTLSLLIILATMFAASIASLIKMRVDRKRIPDDPPEHELTESATTRPAHTS